MDTRGSISRLAIVATVISQGKSLENCVAVP